MLITDIGMRWPNDTMTATSYWPVRSGSGHGWMTRLLDLA